MRNPPPPAHVERLVRFENALAELEAYTEAYPLRGAGSLVVWEALVDLAQRLKTQLDRYELDGLSAPVRDEIAGFSADLAARRLEPDRWLSAHLAMLLDDLEAPAAPAEAWLTVHVAQAEMPLPAPGWPETLLSVRPADLERLLETRQAPHPPGA